jgi:hypothetical protein
MRVLRKLPRRPVGILSMTTSRGLKEDLMQLGRFHRAFEEETALGLGAYTRRSLRLMLGWIVYHDGERKDQRPLSSGSPGPRIAE